MYAGHMENGRRYQTKREGEYWGPSDDKQVGICRLSLFPLSSFIIVGISARGAYFVLGPRVPTKE